MEVCRWIVPLRRLPSCCAICCNTNAKMSADIDCRPSQHLLLHLLLPGKAFSALPPDSWLLSAGAGGGCADRRAIATAGHTTTSSHTLRIATVLMRSMMTSGIASHLPKVTQPSASDCFTNYQQMVETFGVVLCMKNTATTKQSSRVRLGFTVYRPNTIQTTVNYMYMRISRFPGLWKDFLVIWYHIEKNNLVRPHLQFRMGALYNGSASQLSRVWLSWAGSNNKSTAQKEAVNI